MLKFLYEFGSWLLFCNALHKVTVIFSLSPLRATTNTIAIVGRAITLEKEPSKRKQRTDTKKDAKRIIRVITIQGAIEKSPPIFLGQLVRRGAPWRDIIDIVKSK